MKYKYVNASSKLRVSKKKIKTKENKIQDIKPKWNRQVKVKRTNEEKYTKNIIMITVLADAQTKFSHMQVSKHKLK